MLQTDFYTLSGHSTTISLPADARLVMDRPSARRVNLLRRETYWMFTDGPVQDQVLRFRISAIVPAIEFHVGYTQWPLTGELLCNFYGLEPLGVALHCAMDENEFVHGEAEFRLHFTAAGLLRLWNSTLGHTVRTQGQVHRRESSTGAHAVFFWHICNGIVVTLLHEGGR